MLHSDLTGKVIEAFYEVYNTLGYGFLEKVYEKAMVIELRDMGLHVEKQYPINVFYKGHEIGNYFADIVINHKVIIELKAATALAEEHEAQLLNYLKATGIEVGLLLNFGQTPEFKRKILTNKNPRPSAQSA